MIVFIGHLDAAPREIFARAAALMPPRRRAAYEGLARAMDRRRCAAAWLLTAFLMRAAGLSGLPDIRRRDSGQPVLFGYPEYYLSLSHSGPYAAAALEKTPVGIDIQVRRAPSLALLRFCSNDGLDGRDGRVPVTPAGFTKFWSRNESLVKLTGEGITRGFARARRAHPDVSTQTFAVDNGAAFLSVSRFKDA